MSISPITFWLILALVLAGSEMLTGTFYLLAIALGAASGALAAWAGVPIGIQIFIVALVSLAGAKLLRTWKKKNLPSEEVYPMLDLGQKVSIVSWKNERSARVKHRGSHWDAELTAEATTGETEYLIQEIKANTLILTNIKSEK